MVFHSSHKYQTSGRGIIDDNVSCMVGREEDWELGWGAIEGYYLRHAEKRLPTIFV